MRKEPTCFSCSMPVWTLIEFAFNGNSLMARWCDGEPSVHALNTIACPPDPMGSFDVITCPATIVDHEFCAGNKVTIEDTIR